MPSHKRRAESLLPTRAPKQRRTNHSGLSSDGPSASEKEGTLSRWLSFAGQLALDFGRELKEALFKEVSLEAPSPSTHLVPSDSMPGPSTSILRPTPPLPKINGSDFVSKSMPLITPRSGHDEPSLPSVRVKFAHPNSPLVTSNHQSRGPQPPKDVLANYMIRSSTATRPARQDAQSPSLKDLSQDEPEASASTPRAGTSNSAHGHTPSRSIPPRPPLPENFRTKPSEPSASVLAPATPKTGLQRPQARDGSYYRSMAPPPSPHLPPIPTPLRPAPSNSRSSTMAPYPPLPIASASAPSSVLHTPFSSYSTSQPTKAEVQETRAKVEKRRRGASTRTKGKSPRQHIYAKVHEARVRDVWKQDRLAMQKELYEAKRAKGYSSDFKTFKSYMSYRELLESQENLIASRSLTDLRAVAQEQALLGNRRHSFGDGASDVFFERALKIARDTLNSHKPLQPFVPTPQQRLVKAKNDEIERRLHGPKPLPEALPPQDDAEVNDLLAKRGVISRVAREQVTDRDISRLRPHQWLNDEIINFYGQMILTRSEECGKGKAFTGANGVNGIKRSAKARTPKSTVLDVHYFSTFFWPKLTGEGYEKGRLAKWTKKFDIFAKDAILIPVNHSNSHWTGAAINFRQKRIESYDSMGMARQVVFKTLRQYLDLEHQNKKKTPFDFTGWIDHAPDDTPQQENGFDCGVFTCQFLESLSRGQEVFNFSQRDMLYLRRRMIWEIGHGQLRNGP